jgi:hypothetical protein
MVACDEASSVSFSKRFASLVPERVQSLGRFDCDGSDELMTTLHTLRGVAASS